MLNFEGRVAVVTGAGSGIGRGLVLRAAELGMKVVAADIEQPRLDETVELATAATPGVEVVGIRTDVSLSSEVERLAQQTYERFGAVHLLCNNAGVFMGGLLWERAISDFEWLMSVNVYGIVHGIRAFVPRMLQQPGDAHIVNTASMNGMFSTAYSGPYCASKFAALALTECLAHDLRAVNSRIGVSVLVPSLVATAIADAHRNRQERYVERGRDDEGADAAFVAQVLRDQTAGAGMPPSEVAQLVFAAVERGDFYIPTKPSFHDQIRGRFEAQQELRLPPAPFID